ncbi:MAG: class II fructose-bisphosphatase [Chloroflexi bacterium]|jgi:fructose-1,6-bisphosphatase II|nr:class II fructose-bisphosphatase [Chloroflexota bacterium]
MTEQPERNLGMELVRVTEAAALAAARWMGRGKKEAGDGAAVDAMRLMLDTINMNGVIVIGEGEKDEAPMLYNGERIGNGTGPEMDVAVDPVEGTTLLAQGKPNAIAVIAASPKGSMWNPGPGFYMEKIAVGPDARDAIDLDAPVGDNLRNVAKALGKDVRDLTVFVLERPRHDKIIAEIGEVGARVALHHDGDVAGSLMAACPGMSSIDLMINIGGTPEGVITACALKALGGQILGRLAPQSEEERTAVAEAGLDTKRILTVDDMVNSDDVFFAATGITSPGHLMEGVKYESGRARTYSMVIRGKSGTIRYIESVHNLDKLMLISAIDY